MDFNIKEQKIITEEEIKNSNGIVYDPCGDEMVTPETLPDTNEILDEVIKILEYMNIDEMKSLMEKNQLDYEEKMEEVFSDFSSRYYGIFRMIISGEDITPLYKMLSLLDEVKKGDSTIENAETNIGKYLTKFLPEEIVNKMEDGILTEKDIKVKKK